MSWESTDPEDGLRPSGLQVPVSVSASALLTGSTERRHGRGLLLREQLFHSGGCHHPHFPFTRFREYLKNIFLGTSPFRTWNTCHISVSMRVSSLVEPPLSNREERNWMVRKFNAWAGVYPGQFQERNPSPPATLCWERGWRRHTQTHTLRARSSTNKVTVLVRTQGCLTSGP